MLLWMEGFDHYGGSSETLRAVWAVYDEVRGVLSTTHARTGTWSFRVGANDGTDEMPALRRSLGDVYDTVGIGAAFFLKQLSTTDLRYVLFEFLSPFNDRQMSVFVDTVGRIVVRFKHDTAVIATSPVIMTAQAWHHVEAKLVCHPSAGSIEVRVNGAVVILETGINTQGDASYAGVGSVATNVRLIGGASPDDEFWVDDWYAWNDQGGVNDDFIGDRRVFTLMPGTETSAADFVAVGASDPVQAINELSPDDASYIEAGPLINSVPAVTEVAVVNDLPANIGIINAVQTYARARKSGTARCQMQISVITNEDTAEGDDRPVPSEDFAYYTDIHQTSPDGSDMWATADLNLIRIARTD